MNYLIQSFILQSLNAYCIWLDLDSQFWLKKYQTCKNCSKFSPISCDSIGNLLNLDHIRLMASHLITNSPCPIYVSVRQGTFGQSNLNDFHLMMTNRHMCSETLICRAFDLILYGIRRSNNDEFEGDDDKQVSL